MIDFLFGWPPSLLAGMGLACVLMGWGQSHMRIPEKELFRKPSESEARLTRLMIVTVGICMLAGGVVLQSIMSSMIPQSLVIFLGMTVAILFCTAIPAIAMGQLLRVVVRVARSKDKSDENDGQRLPP